MNVDQLNEWIKDSVWGVLTIGAAGSILATTLLFVLKKISIAIFPKIVQKLKEMLVSIYFWMIKKAIDDHLQLFFKESKSKLNAYYASLLAKIIIGFFISTWLFWGAFQTYQNDSILSSIIMTSIALLSTFLALRSYLCLSAAWNFDFEAKITKSANSAIDRAVESVKESIPDIIEEALKENSVES